MNMRQKRKRTVLSDHVLWDGCLKWVLVLFVYECLCGLALVLTQNVISAYAASAPMLFGILYMLIRPVIEHFKPEANTVEVDQDSGTTVVTLAPTQYNEVE